MSLRNRLIILFFVGLFAQDSLAVQKTARFRWSPKIWRPLDAVFPFRLRPSDLPIPVSLLPNRTKLLRAGNEYILTSAQYVEGAKISGTWLQSVYSGAGQLLTSSGEIWESIPEDLSIVVKAMRTNSSFARKQLQAQSIDFRNAYFVWPVYVEILNDASVPQPVWIIEFLGRNQDRVFRAEVDVLGKLKSLKEIGDAFSEGRGIVFPRGPKESALAEVALPNLAGDGYLRGAKLSVFSALDLPAFSPNLFFQFIPEDKRFDQVQVYYFLDKALSWFKNQLGIELPSTLQAKVQVGTNGISNAAFYHANTIYLGSGDGKTYRDLLKDPTVAIHESAHAIIERLAGLPTEGEGGSFNEGFADFFTALILDTPHMAEASYIAGPYRRSLKNRLLAYADFDQGVYKNGTIIGGTLWDIKERIGTDRVAGLALRILVRLGKGARFDDFVPAVVSACAGYCTPDETKVVEEALINRGWRMLANE